MSSIPFPRLKLENAVLLLATIPTYECAYGFETQGAHSSGSHHAPSQRDLSVGPVMLLYIQIAWSGTPEAAALHIWSKPDQLQ